MGNLIEARKLIKDILNSQLLDPYNGTRPGNNPKQFYDKGDGLNLTRGDSFPKGFITSEPIVTEKQGIGASGHSNESGTINIWYFVKNRNSYTDGNNITYEEEDYVTYMIGLIKKLLLNNLKISNEYHIKNFGTSDGPSKSKEGNFTVYMDVLPITIYWSDIYGNN